MAEEALKCFTTLLESIPGWVADLEDILSTAAERQKQLLFENQPQQEQGDEQPIDSCHSQPERPSASSSTRSQRSRGSRPDLPTSKELDAAAPKQIHITQSDALRIAQRKRKTASAVSDHEGAPYKYRSRSTALIYYDGDTQKRFEGIVRRIGTSRNSLRKGKIGAFAAMMSGVSGAATNVGSSDGSDPLHSIALRSTRSRRPPPTEKGDETEPFDAVDLCLEQAQAMCERAAHQILRDGDCTEELKQAQEHFGEARKIGEAESLIWELRAKVEAGEASGRSASEPAIYGTSKLKPATITILSSSSAEKLLPRGQSPSPESHALEIEIEAESSDDEASHDVGLESLQLPRPSTRRPHVRGGGLAAG